VGGNTVDMTREEFWRNFYGPNQGYILELFEQYLMDPNSVDEETRNLFDTYGNPSDVLSTEVSVVTEGNKGPVIPDGNFIKKIFGAAEVARNIRSYGHLAANIDPVRQPSPVPMLELSHYGVTEADLLAIPADAVWPNAPKHLKNGLQAIERLREIYTGDLAYEFSQVNTPEERLWLQEVVESGQVSEPLTPEEKRNLLYRLTEVESFEKYLHRTFAGQKRFSIEGVDAVVPMLDKLVKTAVSDGTRNVMIGMAHRGRLNVLAHVLRKPYEIIFSEFHSSPNKELVPSEGSMGINYGWTGDVKYHLGASRNVGEGSEVKAHLTLANNPSHLEFVDPVIQGYARAAQDDRTNAGTPSQDVRQAIAVLIHGDAAFPGEGVVAETLNMSRLRGYTTGGTIHMIANNHIGFTAEEDEGRSTRYSSDLAKGYEIPVVHVSADHPEACLAAIRLAYLYRERFHKDFMIDVIGYRRWGHNEMDDPASTQPLLYKIINDHPTVRALYAETLKSQNVVNDDDVAKIDAEILQTLKDAYAKVAGVQEQPPLQHFEESSAMPKPVTLEELQNINKALLTYPETFNVYPKLKRILDRRTNALDEGGEVDWAMAESLAFATILSNGTPIRLTGQDSERGTFGHRHLVLHDVISNQEFIPLQALPSAKASFIVHNSPLNEGSVLGFEYGYNVQAPETLVMWEAQFGDFANAGQVLIDQFISAGLQKWGQSSGLVMLLPHGYEGQGPEHSSGRVERYLQLSAQNNWTVANVTTSAQYFHLLRLQAERLGASARPLVVMTPKSLLRNPKAACKSSDFTDTEFQPLLRDGRDLADKDIRRLVLCSGKVAVDLQIAMEKSTEDLSWVSVARVEQLYPLPEQEIQEVIANYKNLKEIVWMQEEPSNMGAWSYMFPRLQALLPNKVKLRYIGRSEQASPAEGHATDHNSEQARILNETMSKTLSPVLQ
jgi:2-oxoglutarate dehydrogenase E1 component